MTYYYVQGKGDSSCILTAIFAIFRIRIRWENKAILSLLRTRNVKKCIVIISYIYRIHRKTLTISELFINYLLFASYTFQQHTNRYARMYDLETKVAATLSRKGRAFYNRDISPVLLTVEKASKLRGYILYELMETVRVHLIITNNIIFCFHMDILCHFPQYLEVFTSIKAYFFLYIFIYRYFSLI